MSQTKSPAVWVPTVYFAMGLPMVLLSDVSLLMFKDLGISDGQITFWASLLTLPWSLKPLFSPVMEIFGTKKQYVVLTELVSAVVLGLIFAGLGIKDFFPVTIALMALMAISGSMHDIAGDGTYMQHLSQKQQSQYIGWQGAAYNIAKIFARGALVYLVGSLSKGYGVLWAWRAVFVLAGVIMLLVAIYHLVLLPGQMREPKEEQEPRSLSDAMKSFVEIFISFFGKRYIWFYLLFILLYRLTEGFAIKIAPLFLKAEVAEGGIGLTNEQFGVIYGTAGTVAFIIGSILSGYFISHYGLRRVLFLVALIFNVPFVVYFLLAYFQPESLGWVAGGITLEYFGYGFGFVGLNLFMMQQVAPGPHQMAHYAIGTSLMNLSVMLPGMVSGFISDQVGYELFFLIALVVAIPGLICAYKVPFTYDEEGNKI
ncbi:MFS transporter [uncultured Porphyromonas sp.]|uniref:MFS transporter n=1 Tax=uncultured Porphyromonas sp. TaxID=159274 RepID=UPI0026275193|nr:MFS transporter [uncultured Porphyromonas sp.]